MGIHNREYFRDDDESPERFSTGPPGSRGSFFSSAIGTLVLLNVVVFLINWLGVLPLNRWLQLPATFEVVGADGAEVVLRWKAFVSDDGEKTTRPVPPGRPLPENTYVRQIRTGEAEKLRLSRSRRPGELKLSGRLPSDFALNPGSYTKVVFAGEQGLDEAVVKPESLTSIAWQFPWRIVTYGFCHDKSNLLHIIFNMFILWMFGRLIESIYGRREFLWFFLAGVVASAACHLALQQLLGDVIPVIGASGGVMAVTIIAAMHFPRMKVRLLFFPFFPIEMRYMAIGIVALDALGLFNPGSSTAHAAHLGGAAFGFLYHRFNWRFSGLTDGLTEKLLHWKKRAARPQVRVYRPPVDGLDDQVDAILEKISRDGEESLTDRERQTLMEASRRKREGL